MTVKPAAGSIRHTGRTIMRRVIEHDHVTYKSFHSGSNEDRKRLRELGFLVPAFHQNSQHF
ncbi:hypothetical protein D3C77_808590 [compost metagenome]